MADRFDLGAVETAFVEASIDPSRWGAAMNTTAAATDAVGAVLFCMRGNLPGAPHSHSLERACESYINQGWIDHDERHRLMPEVAREICTARISGISA